MINKISLRGKDIVFIECRFLFRILNQQMDCIENALSLILNTI